MKIKATKIKTMRTPRPLDGRRSDPMEGMLTCRSYSLPAPASLDAESRSVEATLTTENPVMVLDLARWEPVLEVLRMDGARFPAQVPLLDSHDRSSITKIAGSTREFRVEGKSLVGKRSFDTGELGEKAFNLVKSGHLTDGSIGYRIAQFTTIEPGKSKNIKGTTYKAPPDMALRVVTRWELKEDSLTPIGADPAAKARNFNPIFTRYPIMKWTKKQIEWLKSRGYSDEEIKALDAVTADELRAEYVEEHRQTPPPDDRDGNPDDDADVVRRNQKAFTEGQRAEAERRKTISEMAGADIPAEVLQRAINENMSVVDAQGLFFRTLREQRPPVEVPNIRTGERTNSKDAVVAGLLMRAGYNDIAERDFNEETLDAGHRFRDLSLHDLCRHALQLERQAQPHSREDMYRAAFSTSTLPYILGAVANKSIMRGYTALPSTWRKIARTASVSNFQTQTRAGFAVASTLPKVGQNGNIPLGSANDRAETYRVHTYAERFAVTRENIYNDDLNAFSRVPEEYGKAAARTISDVFWEHFMSNPTMGDSIALFYATTHLNLNASAALSTSTLEDAIIDFMAQTDGKGKPIGVMPKFLIVPPALTFTARRLVESPLLMATDFAADASTTAPSGNVLKGMAEVLTEVRLSNAAFTNNSTTTWYMAADPAAIDTIEVGFLNGKDTPTVERFDSTPETLGVIFRAYLDFGVKALDWRGLAKATA